MRVVRRARPGREPDTAVTQVVEEGPAPPGGPPPEPPLDRELWPWLLVLLVLVIAGIVAAVLLTRHHNNRNSTPTETATAPTATRPAPAVARVTIPSLVGSQASDAVRRLRAQGLQPRVVSVFSTKPRATVVAQRPAAGARLARGSTVTLNVSKGQAAKPVPDVVGQTESQAVALLKAAGFGATPVEVPSTQTKGTVVAQNPKAGDKAQPDTKVRLNVSKGATSGGSAATPPATTAPAATSPAPAQTAPSRPAQPATVTVPAVEGKTLDEARRALSNAGIVTAIRYVPSDLPSGTVVAQARKSGTTVRRGDHMLITVSFGPQSNASALVTVPNVVGLDEQTAQTRVRGAGFDAVVEDSPTSSAAQDGKVVDEQPAGGTKAPKGSQIILYIGRATSSG